MLNLLKTLAFTAVLLAFASIATPATADDHVSLKFYTKLDRDIYFRLFFREMFDVNGGNGGKHNEFAEWFYDAPAKQINAQKDSKSIFMPANYWDQYGAKAAESLVKLGGSAVITKTSRIHIWAAE